MRRHSSPYSIPVLLMLAVLLLARLARAEQAATPPPADPKAAPAQAAPSPELSRVTLKDGQILRGKVLSRDDASTTLELAGGGHVTLPSASIASLSVEREVMISDRGELWKTNPNRTRYLYAPSAMMLRQGEGYFSQKELVFSSASVGLTDHISILAGSALPALAAGASGTNFIFAVKAGFSLNENLHLAAGAETLVLPGLGTGVGFVFGAATVGNPDYNATLSAGRPFGVSDGYANASAVVGDVIVVASGSVRLNPTFALVTENWLFPTLHLPGDNTPIVMINSLALRVLLNPWSIDVGAVRIPLASIPLPWVDFSYHWG